MAGRRGPPPTIDQVIARVVKGAARPQPARPEELARMARIAPMPAELTALYTARFDLAVGPVELLEPPIFEDVNGGRAAFGELADMTYFATDRAEGVFFLDMFGRLGLGPGFVFWVERGLMAADEVVPCGETLAVFLAAVQEGRHPWHAPTLGERALERFRAAAANPPPGVDLRPGIAPIAFVQARRGGGLVVSFALGEILKIADGIHFAASRREIVPFHRMRAVAGGGVVIVGHDPDLGTLGVTQGDWQDLPADRLLACGDPEHPETGRLLGRFADVLTFWIEEVRRA
ncbi:hypothetical protein [Caenispirillum salinarum]|uniref:hypothetical protein n=1 Tax=Caenispirillum salinarum TaxID=859058 RepID=UPI003850ADEE